MKITYEITSETTDQDLSRIAKSLEALKQTKPKEETKEEKQIVEKKRVQKVDSDSREKANVSVSESPKQTPAEDEKSDETNVRQKEETGADTETPNVEQEIPQVDYDTIKKLVLDAKLKGLDFEGAIERGSKGLSRKLIPIKSETQFFGAIYAELQKLYDDYDKSH